jgi:hypothetical protein
LQEKRPAPLIFDNMQNNSEKPRKRNMTADSKTTYLA